MARGKFISLEGGEGAGKSTQARYLVEHLNTLGIESIATREPGGTASAEEIRELWLCKENGHWDALTELLLTMASRREHLVKKVWPALERGVWVVSDRYVDSARVYQGIASGLGIEMVSAIYAKVAGDFMPDLTLLLDLPIEAGLKRLSMRGGETNRNDKQNIEFHKTLRNGFIELSKQDADRIIVIDASGNENEVGQSIISYVTQHFHLPEKP